jgi:hypothetical protein
MIGVIVMVIVMMVAGESGDGYCLLLLSCGEWVLMKMEGNRRSQEGGIYPWYT